MHHYRVPRSFKLRMELDRAEKGVDQKDNKKHSPHEAFITYGISDPLHIEDYDKQLSNWNSSIIGPQNTNIGDRIYMLRIVSGPSYPMSPPDIYFISQINMPGVNQSNGKVVMNQFINWNPSLSMIDCLVAIRQQMVHASNLKQPSASATY